jgi:hypothetical protein
MRRMAGTFIFLLCIGVLPRGSTAQRNSTSTDGHFNFSGPPTQASSSPKQKVIQNVAEYNAYMAALNTENPAQKGAAMEAFSKTYPYSVMKIDSLEQAMAAYNQAINLAKVEEMADRLLGFDSKNVRALAILTALERSKATGGDKMAAKKMQDHAHAGLDALPNWEKPEGMSDEDFRKLRGQMSNIFYAASGFAALQAKDYSTASWNYKKAIGTSPDELQDVYQLGISELEASPLDPDGFWYIAKAVCLAQGNASSQKSVENHGKAKYRIYHGMDDGGDQIVVSALKQSAPPLGFSQSISKAR